MKPWLKKLDKMKAEALAKKNAFTAERFRRNVEVRRRYKEAIEAGKPHGEATVEAVKDSGASMGHSSANLRGWFFALSLDESDADFKWRWRVSVSQSQFDASRLELKEMIEHLGAKFDEPLLIPEKDGTKAVHWRWDHVEEGEQTTPDASSPVAH